MADTCFLRYLGNDHDLRLHVAPMLDHLAVHWKTFEEAEELLDDCQRSTQRPNQEVGRQGGASHASWDSLSEAYAPVILDVSHAAAAASILRELKAINRGIPVIIISEQATLTSFSLALLDGSEALFYRPLVSIEPFCEAIGRAQRRVQRWVAAMENAQTCQIS